MKRGCTRQSSLKGWERAIVSQMNSGTVSKVMGETSERWGDAHELFWEHGHHLELNWTDLMPIPAKKTVLLVQETGYCHQKCSFSRTWLLLSRREQSELKQDAPEHLCGQWETLFHESHTMSLGYGRKKLVFNAQSTLNWCHTVISGQKSQEEG